MKKWLSHTNSAVLSVAAVGIFILLTLFLNSLTGFQADLTASKQYTMSEQTRNAISGVKQDVRLMLFTVSGDGNELLNREVRDLMQEYAKRNKHLKVEEYDLAQQPAMAKTYGLTGASVVVLQGETKRVIELTSLFQSGSGDGSYQFSGEEKLTSALLGLTSDDQGKIVFLTGHEEVALSQMSNLNTALSGEQVSTEELQLAQAGSVPKDADVLAIIGPQRDISSTELKAIQTYMQNGGKLYLSLGFNEDMKTGWKNLDALMGEYGVQDQHAVTIDHKHASSMSILWSVPDFGTHEITDKLKASNLNPLLTLSVALKAKEQDQYEVTPLLQSSSDSYGETNLKDLLNNTTNNDKDQDPQGPLDLGFAVSSKDNKPKAVILGSSTFVQDSEITTGGNRDLALNAFSYLREKSSGVTIRPREEAGYQVAYLTAKQGSYIFTAAVVGIPLLFVMIGSLLWWRRRKA
ncbi:GldG family protein [Paenibacillus sp. JX-17]|uniref:GldG family protein n=1 Tax=Paenibacillus lacisoli TaxID=3064525 RepID=A0ABT9CCJ0_9BACL|nr:GldG family protein [Paenibacillus sp. JX-17]MDO7906975.1 GldG family protein [Paenibacillus sp. JX-17]